MFSQANVKLALGALAGLGLIALWFRAAWSGRRLPDRTLAIGAAFVYAFLEIQIRSIGLSITPSDEDSDD